jgi:hypothetical protein
MDILAAYQEAWAQVLDLEILENKSKTEAFKTRI